LRLAAWPLGHFDFDLNLNSNATVDIVVDPATPSHDITKIASTRAASDAMLIAKSAWPLGS
jgi:hypothetical protein